MSTILVSIVLIAKGAYDYKVVKSSVLAEASKSIELVSQRLKLNLPAAIWMDLSEQITKIGSSELQSPYVYGIEIKTLDGEVKYAQHTQGIKGEEVKQPLVYNEYEEESTVGEIVISIDQKEINTKVQAALIQIIIGVVLVDVLLVLILFILTRVIVTNPLNKVILAVTDIAHGDGDLTKRLDIHTHDEMGALAEQINHFFDKTQAMIKTIITTTQVISDTSSAVKSDVSKANALFEQQYIEIDMLATAITEMAASTKDISLTSQQSSQSSFEAKEQAKKSV